MLYSEVGLSLCIVSIQITVLLLTCKPKSKESKKESKHSQRSLSTSRKRSSTPAESKLRPLTLSVCNMPEQQQSPPPPRTHRKPIQYSEDSVEVEKTQPSLVDGEKPLDEVSAVESDARTDLKELSAKDTSQEWWSEKRNRRSTATKDEKSAVVEQTQDKTSSKRSSRESKSKSKSKKSKSKSKSKISTIAKTQGSKSSVTRPSG